MIEPGPGVILIANPFLKDPNFLRSSVLLCEHNENGTFGLVLNKTLTTTLKELVPEINNTDFPIYLGGPVQPNTLHFIHSCPDLIDGSQEIGDDLNWGGNFETLKILLAENRLVPEKIKFFVGYSGWSPGQLDAEMEIDSWLTVKASTKLIFKTPIENIWSESLKDLGGKYTQLINYPLDPLYN